METRTYWLSFVDSSAIEGQGFRGVCVVDVTEAEAAAQLADLAARFPLHQPGAEWIAAATAKAWRLGCNPGGAVLSLRLDLAAPSPAALAEVPRDRLMSRVELLRRGLVTS